MSGYFSSQEYCMASCGIDIPKEEIQAIVNVIGSSLTWRLARFLDASELCRVIRRNQNVNVYIRLTARASVGIC